MIGKAAGRRSAAPLVLCVLIAACGGNAAPSKPTTSGSASSEPPAATDVAIAAPEDVAFDGAGHLYISEFEGNRVDEIGEGSVFRVVAGTGSSGYAGDGGPRSTPNSRLPRASRSMSPATSSSPITTTGASAR
jgi:hypothetical protein